MASKMWFVFILTAFVSSVNAMREIRLDDVQVNHIGHPLTARAIGIPKNFWDTLRSCHVIFPDQKLYEAYPSFNIPDPRVSFQGASAPFTSCTIGFRGVGVDFSGLYELLSTVVHSGDNAVSLTRQRFNITVSLTEETD